MVCQEESYVHIFGQAQGHVLPILGIVPKNLLEHLLSPENATSKLQPTWKGAAAKRHKAREKKKSRDLKLLRKQFSPNFPYFQKYPYFPFNPNSRSTPGSSTNLRVDGLNWVVSQLSPLLGLGALPSHTWCFPASEILLLSSS